MTRPPRDSSDEAGVTLVELIVAIAISAIIIGAITNAIFVGFRTTDKTTTRLSESHDTQLVATYFPPDVSSSRYVPISLLPGDSPAGCSGITGGGQNVVLLPFAPRPDAADPITVAYRIEGTNLVRYKCGVSGVADRVAVATGISAASAAKSTSGNGTTEQRTVTITVTETSGRMFQVSGHPRTPKAVAPVPTTAPPTTAPPLPCKVLTSNVNPSPIALAAANPDTMVLSGNVTLSVTTEGACSSPLTVTFTPGIFPDAPFTQNLAPSGSTYSATLSATAHAWKADPSKTLAIGQAGGVTVLGTFPTLTVTPAPCTVLSPVSVAPNPVALVNTPANTLIDPVFVSFTTAGTCPALRLRFSPGTAVVTANLASGAGGTWSVTLGASAYPWTAGAKPVGIELVAGGTVINPNFSFTVNPAPPMPCIAASTLSLSPSSVALGTGSNAGTLKKVVTATITTSGTCSGLSLTYNNGSVARSDPMSSTNGTTWTGTIDGSAAGGNWTVGPHVITLVGTTSTPTATLTVT